MNKMQRFNKVVAIAPSGSLDSGIYIDRYSDRIADVFHGYLDPRSETKQVLLVGHAEALAKGTFQAMEPLEVIAERLQKEYKIPAVTIVPYLSESDGVDQRVNDGVTYNPDFFSEALSGEREMGLIADELQMSFGRDVLSALNIQCAAFQVRQVQFGFEGVVRTIPSPITSNLFNIAHEAELPVALAGDN